jgi:hypothetical protein
MIDKSEERSTRHAVRHLTSYGQPASGVALAFAEPASVGQREQELLSDVDDR